MENNIHLSANSNPLGGLLKAYASKSIEEAIRLSNAQPSAMFFTNDTNDIVFNGRKYSGSDALNIDVRWNKTNHRFEVKIHTYMPNGYIWLYRTGSRSKNTGKYLNGRRVQRFRKVGWTPKGLSCSCFKDNTEANPACIRVTEEMVDVWTNVHDLVADLYKYGPSVQGNEEYAYFYPSTNRYRALDSIETDDNGILVVQNAKKIFIPFGLAYVIVNPEYTGGAGISTVSGKAKQLIAAGDLVSCRMSARYEINNSKRIVLYGNIVG